MKKTTFLLGVLLLFGWSVNQSFAQVSVNINIGSQPAWGPVGYDYAQYYYMPDIDAYYSIPKRQFIYLDGGRWVFARSLPSHYHYDLDRGYKVVINDRDPWLRNDVYRVKYSNYKGWYGKQTIIRDSRDPKYKKHYNNGRGNKNGHYKGNKGNGHKHHD
ncbi:hypothetical protein SAMN05660909_03662 [Chitinophaga terrae (ex Kim and Jung 2007)]|jgi:hypothetical protein|uniref:Uncharacterized protein n=1 Tax=Chitinophaga terrae (ex Kim and Jung 2007) TaxID=408074 RepID=A0A1H4ECX0_9BACT|nr:hypothetical protein [Chitinophaga terrae (ex Kim and Jung 2007)]MDQ0105535.1 hypothetical protein [Chitinophaga terrae (ex Kim and Jung 2007)]GEP91576.1 hypothetical protein CTE07_32210 [Chitinophaga terrae (ex Kim and Jung 2007)]SEA82895.1 hypothetical protein SAMN05660909_03662 [Chitinophaga terrae (ex Kim and Jung 2007)]